MRGLNFKTEEKLLNNGYFCIAGIDEVGRGAWAGPLVGAAVVLDQESESEIINANDSKLLNPSQRQEVCELIKKYAAAWSIIEIDSKEIDEIGIGKANAILVERCIDQLKLNPDYLLIDKMKINQYNFKIDYDIIVKGDSKVKSIACASIIAKVYRDQLMDQYSKEFPQYGFTNHKGYGTTEHQKAVIEYGPCSIHRKSYKPINQPKLGF